MNGLRNQFWTALALALATGACAKYKPTTKLRFGSNAASTGASSGSNTSPGGNNNGSWGQGQNPPSTLRCDVGQEPLTYSYVGRGYYDDIRQTGITGRILRMQGRAEVNTTIVEGTLNFTPQYSRLGWFLQVFEDEQQTPMMRNGTYGGTHNWSPVLDFSSALPSLCPNNDPTCRQPFEVRYSKWNSDYLAVLQNTPGAFHNHVQSGPPAHTFEFSVRIETDDTNSLECP